MADIPRNMQAFDLVTLRIFDRLYEAFPVPTEITPGSIGIEVTPDDASGQDAWNAISVAECTLPWLATEGFLRHGQQGAGGKFHDVQLTLKGLTILGSVPESIKPTEVPEPMIRKIRRVLSAGAEKASAEAVKSVLSEVFRLALAASVSATASGVLRA